MARCSATTLSGKRCRCSAGDDGLCATHRKHGDKKEVVEKFKEERRALMPAPKPAAIEAVDDEREYNEFGREYYNVLRELYNVAGAEMREEFESYKSMGREAYDAMHTSFNPRFMMAKELCGWVEE